MKKIVKNLTEGKNDPDPFFGEIMEKCREAGWQNFCVHRIREDGACESHIVANVTPEISSPFAAMVGSFLESCVLQFHSANDMPHPQPGTDGYEEWLKSCILDVVAYTLSCRE